MQCSLQTHAIHLRFRFPMFILLLRVWFFWCMHVFCEAYPQKYHACETLWIKFLCVRWKWILIVSTYYTQAWMALVVNELRKSRCWLYPTWLALTSSWDIMGLSAQDFPVSFCWGDGLAQLAECRTQDPKTRGSNPIRSKHKKKLRIFFFSQKCLCWLAVNEPTPCVYTHT